MVNETIDVMVSSICDLSPSVRQFVFRPVKGGLPPFTPGAHVTLQLGEMRRSYSLTSSAAERDHYRIAVRLEKESKGGSQYMHNSVAVGDRITLFPPDNYFPLIEDRRSKHILIAGGLGITPFLSYLDTIEQTGFGVELHYCFRNRQDAAYLPELENRLGERLFVYESEAGIRLNVDELVKQQPPETHFYVCGPQTLIEAVTEVALSRGEQWVHSEQFTEAEQCGEAFDVYCQQSGITLRVEENMSILQAIEADKRINVECLCRNGVCGTCETAILEGEADHRDHYLTEEEQQAQSTMMICVSRARGRRLVLDL